MHAIIHTKIRLYSKKKIFLAPPPQDCMDDNQPSTSAALRAALILPVASNNVGNPELTDGNESEMGT